MGPPSLWGGNTLSVALRGTGRFSVPKLLGQNQEAKLGSEGSSGPGQGVRGGGGHSLGPELKPWPQVKEEQTGWEAGELGSGPEPPLPWNSGDSPLPSGGDGLHSPEASEAPECLRLSENRD